MCKNQIRLTRSIGSWIPSLATLPQGCSLLGSAIGSGMDSGRMTGRSEIDRAGNNRQSGSYLVGRLSGVRSSPGTSPSVNRIYATGVDYDQHIIRSGHKAT